MSTVSLIERKFVEWTRGRDPIQGRINIFYKIRDIPYAVIPELNDLENYVNILIQGKGACMPKHLLLCHMFRRLGLQVLYTVTPFRWDQADIDYPVHILKLARSLPVSYHFACKVEIEDEYISVDATLDTALEKIGLPVNKNWDGFTDTVSPIIPCGSEELFHPSELSLEKVTPGIEIQRFYRELNQWLETVRHT